uniref:Ribosomal RNA small subunit methyltransferase E n=1 Tax=candidate division WOR-3 bacterium TaxID=2052148 RepID=A0A7C4CBC4_UNCW3
MEIFFAPEAMPDAETIIFGGNTARHISRVMRHRPGDVVKATDGRGTEFELKLTAVGVSRVEGRVLGRRMRPTEPRHKVALAQALLKGRGLAQVVETATELGVSEVIPFLSERTVAKMSAVRRSRLQHVAVSGLETSMRTVLPCIADCVSFEGLLGRMTEFDMTVVAYEGECRFGIDDVLDKDVRSVLAVVGPEGGFSELEIDRLKVTGAKVFSLGPRRLRAATAASTVVALCLQRLGDLG